MLSTEKLLADYRKNKLQPKAEKIKFSGVDSRDVYNITAPFELNGKVIIAGRVEERDSEQSHIYLFEEQAGTWYPVEGSLTFELQDPFVTVIENQVILGGVEVFFEEEQVSWRTVFYYLNSLEEAELLFKGPLGMKDLRLRELPNGNILVLTRPQGEKGGRGKIGSFVIKSLEELSIDKINEAPLLLNQFKEDEWGGANEVHTINDKVIVLGHIASFDKEQNRHYYALLFELNEDFTEIVNPKIIAERTDFLPGPAKRADLDDVVFSGGLVINNHTSYLYAGISDAEAQKIELLNLFV